MISFVFYFHSARMDNLRQTLRLLTARERSIGEILLVCNDRTNEPLPGRVLNMGMKEYCKPVMCNAGVAEARHEVVALLDSDRILPPKYFSRGKRRLEPGTFVSCRRMLNLARPHTDDEIEEGSLEFAEEFRAEGWELWRKNLFSGNTMFFREDYVECGGMDESFVGFGFADTDMTRNVLSRGYRAVWTDADEIHLHHPKNVFEAGEESGRERRLEQARGNLCRLLRKWRDREYWANCPCMI
jgi:hypothetical protein